MRNHVNSMEANTYVNNNLEFSPEEHDNNVLNTPSYTSEMVELYEKLVFGKKTHEDVSRQIISVLGENENKYLLNQQHHYGFSILKWLTYEKVNIC